MLKTIKRLIAWTGPFKGRLQTGYLFSFLSAMFTAMPIMLAAYGLNLVIEDWRGIRPLAGAEIWLILLALVLLVLGRAFFSYLRASWQDSIAYEQTAGERINHARTRQAAATGARVVVSACPYCLTMFSDGIKELNAGLQAMDIAEVILERLG